VPIPLFGGIVRITDNFSTSTELPPEIADGAIWSVMMVPTPSQSAPSPSDDAHSLFTESRPTISLIGLGELHRTHCGRLLRFFARHGARQDAADLVQESFARLAVARAKRGTPIERPEAYLSTIASNLLRDRAKIALRRSLAWHVPIDEVPVAGHDPIAALEARDQLKRLQASLARLSPKTRSIFLAHRRDGVSYKDIANQTGLSVKAVERRMSKAIAHIDRLRRAH
jgi:RNA polymerase sigma-70 factor (ECF subfamily)